MELVFDMVSAPQQIPGMAASKTFRHAGGIIGRSDDCDWVIPDRNRVISGRHALVSYDNGAFFLTDTSSNGIQIKDSGMPLSKGQAVRIEHGNVYCLGEFEIRAKLVQDPTHFETGLHHSQPTGSIIPDDAFLDLDPLNALDQQERMHYQGDSLSLLEPVSEFKEAPLQPQDYARIDTESLTVPELVPPPPPPAPAPQPAIRETLPSTFWAKYEQALGVSLDGLSDEQREALALSSAALLRQCIGNLQQSLKTRSELKADMRLAQTTVQSAGNNPLKHTADGSEAMTALLRRQDPGQMPANHAVGRAFRDLQAHQVALSAASRAAVKAMFEHLSPEQLTLRFERENKSLLNTAGGRWRAYTKLYQAMQSNDDWSKRLFARDFAMAYEEQIRLIATLNTDIQG
ncbi:MAG: type VI secretion system-associated FHA domain protein TagH [Gammaproteobacteria bacterium HGW-Gammaproteobacteria-11]|nr:MAG: type VI secretion system-associated FHA domain protein TagH [Gammaproteobacteria bacterium HGW-Gammaproteobacteria-11]